MSSKRGRKRNDNLPPNRARDVQRAFRARRAAHLQALETRVSELEEENDYLRRALSLPPSNRPMLGKGPTGKDKANSNEPPDSRTSPMASSRESSNFTESPPSRHSSTSPPSGHVPVSMSPDRPMTVLGESTWDDGIVMSNQAQPPSHPPAINHRSYQMPMSSSMPMKSIQYPSYSNSAASSSRHPPDLYNEQQGLYSQAASRSLNNDYSTSYPIRDDLREDLSRAQYPYPLGGHSSHGTPLHFPNPSSNDFHNSHTPENAKQIHHPQPTSAHGQDRQRGSPPPFIRRSATNPGFSLGREGYPHPPVPSHLSLNARSHLPDFLPRAQDAPGALGPRGPYSTDNHFHTLL